MVKRKSRIWALLHELKKYGAKEVIYHILSFFFQGKYTVRYLHEKEKYYHALKGDWLKREIEDDYQIFLGGGRCIDLDHPETFNEKIQWLKAYDNNLPDSVSLTT